MQSKIIPAEAVPSKITMDVTLLQPWQNSISNALKTVFAAGLFYWILLDCTVIYCVLSTICQYAFPFLECSV